MTAHQRFLRASSAPLAAALIALGACDAHALSMGKVRVQSALGQSLVAEIDLADLSEEDAKSLKSALAPPSAFAGMGLEFNPALNGTQIALQRRSNGNRYLKLSTSRPLNDPFVDIVVELSWASGRIVRTYTILLDPPKAQESASAAALPASAPETPSVATTPKAAQSAAPVQATPAASLPAPAATPTAAKSAAPSAPAINPPATASTDRKRIRVRRGDTAGKIALSMAPEGVSVEQMLVAMLNTSPGAFANGNVNRLRANVEILTPDTALVKKTSQSQARQIIDSQNQDFQALRRGLASQAPLAPAATKPSEAAGPVTKPIPPIEPKAAPSDTLKLSKGSVQDKADKANMEQIAQQRAKTEARERARELAKNIEELNQLAKVAAKPEAAVAPAAPALIPSPVVSAPAAVSTASAPVKDASPAVTSGLPVAPAPSKGDLLASISQNPGISGMLLALLGLLAGYVGYRRRQARQSAATNESRGQWDSTASTSFDVGGGARIDTAEVGTTALNSTLYPDSQLEIAQELDPVAEAEVYLAYGKDVPAEEILKEGLQHDPKRVAIHLKLLSIFAKRDDVKSFEAMAREVSALVQASGPDWEQVQEMGRSLDPSNPLYGVPAVTQPGAANFQQSMFSLDAESLQALSASSKAPGAVAAQALAASTEARFDLPSVALESQANTQVVPAAVAPSPSTDRLDATLALAEQFLEIGEKEGARALLEEVISGGSDSLRQRATSLLSKAG